MAAQITFIVIGAYFLVLNGILGFGKNWGRSKRFSNLVGEAPARITYAVIGAALIVYGILALSSPELLPT